MRWRRWVWCRWPGSLRPGKLKGKVVTTGDNGVTPIYAAAGVNPLYQGNSNSGVNPLYTGNDLVTPPGYSNVGFPSINASGAIAFQSVTGSPDTSGIFVRPAGGGTLITISGSSFGDAKAAPAVNDEGTVVFGALPTSPGGGMPVVRLSSSAPGGSVPITIFGSEFGARSRPAINKAGDVSVEGTIPGTDINAIFVQPAGGGVRLTIRGEGFALRGVIPPRDVKTGQSSGRRSYSTAVYDNGLTEPVRYDIAADGTVTGPLKWMAPESIRTRTTFSVLLQDGPAGTSETLAVCNGETIQLCGDTSHFRNPGDPIKPDEEQIIVALGDPLDGSTIAGLSLAPQSWGGDSSLTFFASLANGSSGLYVWSLPEPATLAAAMLAVPMLRRRR